MVTTHQKVMNCPHILQTKKRAQGDIGAEVEERLLKLT